jgi:hypothetical protein
MTTQNQIDAIKTLCEQLKSNPSIDNAYVNDWGKFGNFDIFVVPVIHDRNSTRKIKSIIKQFLTEDAKLRQAFGPDAIYEYRGDLKKAVKTGYNRSYWSIDIDYQQYNTENNTFST